MEVLSVKKISKSIKNKQIINEISFDIAEGQIVGLLGPNGAGKTTTFYSILGLIKIDSGEVFLQDRDITIIPPHKRAEVGMSYLPQEPSIFRNLSVKSNILGVAEKNFLENSDLEDFYQRTIREFGLEAIEDSMGYVLSGGQRRKVEIARCLASKPKLILLDEPFAGIDPIAIEDIKSVLKNLSNKGISILITDHNLRETMNICNYSIVIKDGSILDKGDKDYLINSSLIKEEYFGKVFD
jgi:lipopolysaccharide export system ATP-binding protein